MTQDSEPLPKDQQQLRAVLRPLIQEYLKEIKSPLRVDEFLREQLVAPIRIDGMLMGFWGLRVRSLGGAGKLATIKAFYLRRAQRGKHLNRAADDLIRGLTKQGVTELEIWAHPKVQFWLEKRYGIKPKICITHNRIDVFQIFEE
jgi:hypothetical protein